MDKAQTTSARTGIFARLGGGDTFASLENGQFRLLLAGTGFSQLASWMEEVARGWLVLQLTDSPFQLGLMGFIRGISQLVVSPFAGALADRLDRKRLAMIAQVVGGLQAILIGVLISTDLIAMWQLYILVWVAGVTSAVYVPTRQVLVYDVVGGRNIANAIALNSVTANVSRIVAPSVGGVVIGTVGTEASYYVQSVFLAMATTVTFMLRLRTHAEPIRAPIWESIRDGARYARNDPTVFRLVLLNVVPNLLIYPYVGMMPLFAERILDVGSGGYGLLLTAAGVGAIPGGLIVANMSNSRWKGRAMGVAALLYMGMVMAFSQSEIFPLSFGFLVIAGIGWSMMVTLNQTLLQMNVADEFRGRILSLYTMASGFTPFGSLAMGAAAGAWGVQTAVFFFALAGFATATVLGLGSARMRRL
jgi:MFS family permease